MKAHLADDQESGLAELFGRWLARRLQPSVGWPFSVLALLAALCPALGSGGSPLRLPLWLLVWAGALGCWLGLGLGRLAGAVRAALLGLLLPLALLWAVAACDALPPPGLVVQDLGALASWMGAALAQPLALLGPPPTLRSATFLAEALPRAARALLAAPGAGEQGARLLVASTGAALTWSGALLLGWALASGRSLLGWSWLLLAALLLIGVLGGGGGLALIVGMGSLLLLTICADFRQREQGWATAAVAYSDQLSFDVGVSAVLLVAATLLLAWLLPSSWDTLLARWIWADVEVPSGIAALERQARGTPTPAVADVGLSQLPTLPLGLSLEQGPPEQLALLVQVAQPLPPSPWPRYWRARLLNRYSGRSWSSDAHVRPFRGLAPDQPVSAGMISQQITDRHLRPTLIVGLPEIAGLSVPAQAEYLDDGTLTALTAAITGTYELRSWPQQQGAATTASDRPPDLRPYLLLPANLPQRVRELAQAIGGDGPPARKALALEAYLRALPYSYAATPVPSDGEAVDQFLFEMRQGYCTYYASAMAIMARSLGIPSRLAMGYSSGSFDASQNVYRIYERDAHAWPELYIDGQWQPFEPTPIRPLPARGTQQPAPQPTATPVPAPAPASGLPWLALLGGIAVLLAAGAAYLALRWRRVPLTTQAQRWLEAYGAGMGVAWPQGATLHEYQALLAAQEPQAAGVLREAVEIVGRARYGGQHLSEAEQRRLRVCGEHLRRITRRAWRWNGGLR